MKKISASFLFLPFAVFAADTNAQPALAPPYPEMPPSFWEQHKVAVAIGVLLFIAAQFFTLYKVMMRLQPRVEPPENLARTILNRLLDEPEDGKLLSEVSRVLRRYFASVFQTPGAEATTAEFISELAMNPKITPDLAQKLASFLRECDARKFSPAHSASPLDAAERALDFVNEAEAIRVKQNSKAA